MEIIDIKLCKGQNSEYTPPAYAPKTLDQAMYEYVLHVYETCNKNQSMAAHVLGINRNTVASKLRKGHIKYDQKRI